MSRSPDREPFRMAEGCRLPTETECARQAMLRGRGQLRLRPCGWWRWKAKQERWVPCDQYGKPDHRDMVGTPPPNPPADDRPTEDETEPTRNGYRADTEG